MNRLCQQAIGCRYGFKSHLEIVNVSPALCHTPSITICLHPDPLLPTKNLLEMNRNSPSSGASLSRCVSIYFELNCGRIQFTEGKLNFLYFVFLFLLLSEGIFDVHKVDVQCSSNADAKPGGECSSQNMPFPHSAILEF